MLKVGDKFSARAHGSNHIVGLDYRCDDLFEVVYIDTYGDGCTLKHLKTEVQFKERQYQVEVKFKKYVENEQERFIIENINQVDSMTLSTIKLLVQDSVGKPKKETTVSELEQKLDAQTEVLAEIVQVMKEQQLNYQNTIKMIKYKASLHGLNL